MKNYEYTYERIYKSDICKVDSKVQKYWQKILSEDIYTKIDTYEDGVLGDVLSNKCYKSKYILEESYVWMCYVRKEYENVQLVISDKELENKYFFTTFLIPFIKIAEYLLLKKTSLINHSSKNSKIILSSFEDNVCEKLIKCCSRTLIFEMNLSRMSNELKGETPEEEYQYFLKEILTSTRYINELSEEYPALIRVIIEVIDNLVEFYAEVINRFYYDEKEISRIFATDNNDLQRFIVGGSDLHNHGKSVVLFEFKNGKQVLYKPHSISNEIKYHEFIVWLGKQTNIEMIGYEIIDKGEYGWEECIANLPCSEEAQLERYYTRMGLILCANYILNVYDLHNENIIAHGEYPIIIDTETILKNHESYNFERINDVTLNKIRSSVIGQGLLPIHIHKGKNTASIDISGMSHEGGEEYPLKVATIINRKRSDMQIDYTYITSKATNNLPVFNDKGILPCSYVQHIINGFSDVYRYVINNKQVVIEKSTCFNRLKLRHLRRDTQTYAMVLDTSLHPDFLNNAASRELFLMTLAKNRNIEDDKEYAAIRNEVLQMLNNDIPMFYYNADSKDLLSEYGLVIKNYFQRSACSILIGKIQEMDMQDLKQQMLYIVLAIKSLGGESSEYFVKRQNIDYVTGQFCKENIYKQIYNKCLQIIKKMQDCAIYNVNRDRINWIGVSMGGIDEVKWNVVPLSYNLYDGVGGIAIFMHTFQKKYNDNMCLTLCEKLDHTLEEHLGDILEVSKKIGIKQSSGGFIGECSLLYVYTVLYEITQREYYLLNAEKLYDVIKEQIFLDKDNDIMSGNAGAIIVLLKMLKLTGNKKYLDLACIAGEVLLKNGLNDESNINWIFPGQTYPVSGLSHGYSGIAIALFKLYKVSGNKYFKEVAEKAILEEDKMYNDRLQNWADKRVFYGKTGEEQGNNPVTWCHGAGGILLARIKMFPYVDNDFKDIIIKDIKMAVRTLNELGGLKNQCLCHGEIGNLEILSEYSRFANDVLIEEKCEKILAGSLINNKEYWECGLLDGYEHLGFMQGLSGIGYSLLRSIDHDLPCVLALE